MTSHDEWYLLYNTDKEAFEQQRDDAIAAVINAAPEHLRLKLWQLQWKLDAIHRTQNPLKATITMSNMMWESFEEMRCKLNEFSKSSDEEPLPPKLWLVK